MVVYSGLLRIYFGKAKKKDRYLGDTIRVSVAGRIWDWAKPQVWSSSDVSGLLPRIERILGREGVEGLSEGGEGVVARDDFREGAVSGWASFTHRSDLFDMESRE